MAVFSLLNLSLSTLAKNVSRLENELDNLPVEVKNKCLKLLSRRGLVSDRNIHRLINKKTQVLDLSQCNGISDVGLRTTTVCCSLVKLDLNVANQTSRVSISSNCLASLAAFWPHLRVAFLRRCGLVNDKAISALARHCPQLRHLNLSGCERVTDESLKSLAKYSRHLESIDMSRTQVSDDGIECLAVGCCQKSLQEVHLGHCLEVSDLAISVLLHNCPQITTLSFHSCPSITDQSRITLATYMSPMRPMKHLTWTVY